jgi:magnesium-transporting ATPase (P-type)
MTVAELFLTRSLELAPPTALRPHAVAADRRFCEVARRCQTVKHAGGGPDAWLGDPMEIALVEMADATGAVDEPAMLRDEIPFDADRRRMATLYDTADGRMLYVKGAPEAVIPSCAAYEADDGPKPLGDLTRRHVEQAADALASRGLRVLALAYRRVAGEETAPSDDSALVLLGLVGFADPPRAGVRKAVAVARAAGIRVIMTTGDHPHTARAVAQQIGLVDASGDGRVVTGEQLRHLSQAQVRVLLDTSTRIYARLAADQKLQLVRELRAKGHVVAVTGDGVNDAPALKEADIGIAMGRSGSDVAREAADIVLVEDDFASIVDAVEEGRAVFDNIRRFLTYILTSNVPQIVPYLAFALLQIPLPLTIVQILAVDLGTDLIPALALGAEPPHPGLMRRPPRPRRQRLLDRPLLLRAYLFLGLFEAVAAMSAYLLVMLPGGWSLGQPLAPGSPLYRQATTACLVAIVIAQMVNVFLCRDERASLLRRRPLGNPLILVGLAFELALILLIVYTPPGNALIGTAPLPASAWLLTLPFAAAMLAAEEARKWLLRRRHGDR